MVDFCHGLWLDYFMTVLHIYRLVTTPMGVQDVKRHDDPELVVLATDECLFADEGFR